MATSHPPIGGPTNLPTLNTTEKLVRYPASCLGSSTSREQYLLRAVSSKAPAMPTIKVLPNSSSTWAVPSSNGIERAPRAAAASSPHCACTSTVSQPKRSVRTPAGPLINRLGSDNAAKFKASTKGSALPCSRIQPLAVMPAKEPAVLMPDTTRNRLRCWSRRRGEALKRRL